MNFHSLGKRVNGVRWPAGQLLRGPPPPQTLRLGKRQNEKKVADTRGVALLGEYVYPAYSRDYVR